LTFSFELTKEKVEILRALPFAARLLRAHRNTRAAFTRSARAWPAALPRVSFTWQMSQVCDKLSALIQNCDFGTRKRLF
ncbi:MAG TPA: hypothetical protein H9729_04210, partial [Candidatus Borkfalkia excrementigallinarum]|nr:hypothetical protein [Candidatus Borkfalkia excrementigallinarum]